MSRCSFPEEASDLSKVSYIFQPCPIVHFLTCLQELWLYPVHCTWRVHCIPSHMYSRPLARPDSSLEESSYRQTRVYIFCLSFKNRSRDQVNLRLAQYLPPLSIKLFIIQILYPCIPSPRRYLPIIMYSNFALKETFLTSSLRETHPSYLRPSLGVF